MKDSRQLRCIGPIRVNFLFLPIIIVVIFFLSFFSDSLTEFILTGYSFFAGGRGGGGGGGGGGGRYDQIRCPPADGVLRCEHATFNGNLYSSAFTCS